MTNKLLLLFQTSFTIESIAAPPCNFPISPYYDCETQSLYYCDILAENKSTLFRYDCRDGLFYSAIIVNEGSASFCIPIEGTCDLFIVGSIHCVYVVKWDGCSSEAYVIRKVFCADQQPEVQKISLGKTDPKGRLYTGTYKCTLCEAFPADCSLYSYDKHRSLQQHIQGLQVSAGLAWNEEECSLYHIDTCLHNLRGFSWDPNTGKLGKH